MDGAAIISAAQAVHQELVGKLAEQDRINRLRDQLRRACPGGAPGLTGLTGPGGTVTLPPQAPA